MEDLKDFFLHVMKPHTYVFCPKAIKKDGFLGIRGRASKSEFLISFYILIILFFLFEREIPKLRMVDQVWTVVLNASVLEKFIFAYFSIIFISVFHRRMHDLDISFWDWFSPIFLFFVAFHVFGFSSRKICEYAVVSGSKLIIYVAAIIYVPYIITMFLEIYKTANYVKKAFRCVNFYPNRYGEIPDDIFDKAGFYSEIRDEKETPKEEKIVIIEKDKRKEAEKVKTKKGSSRKKRTLK